MLDSGWQFIRLAPGAVKPLVRFLFREAFLDGIPVEFKAGSAGDVARMKFFGWVLSGVIFIGDYFLLAGFPRLFLQPRRDLVGPAFAVFA